MPPRNPESTTRNLAAGVFLFLVLASAIESRAEECRECHASRDQASEVPRISPAFATSVHAELACTDCHAGVQDDHAESGAAVGEVRCAACHEEAEVAYGASVHARPRFAARNQTATCLSCHGGGHDILPSSDPVSPVHRTRVVGTCGKCHSRPEVTELLGLRQGDIVARYGASVHGKVLARGGDREVATCVTCHGGHLIVPQADERSPIHKKSMADTCGQCHGTERDEFKLSVHQRAIDRGFYDAPSCSDCHGEHDIVRPSETGAATSHALVSTALCADCHGNERIMRRHGLQPELFTSYFKTYHGLAVLKGSAEAAACVNCHEVHAIRAEADPTSSIHPTHRTETCRKCHPQSGDAFSGIEVHPVDLEGRNPTAALIKYLYYWLIGLVVLGMFLHNLVIFVAHLRLKYRASLRQGGEVRFTAFERVQHLLLLSSFLALVVSGFALAYPRSWWAGTLQELGFVESVRSATHYVAALVLLLVSLIQGWYMVLYRRGRREALAILPRGEDLRYFLALMRYYLELRGARPAWHGRYDYTEKLEYLALIWGTLIMALSGFVLWFPERFLTFLPSWSFEVAEVVHFYEAWLATLSIAVWHWYFAVFSPRHYPLNMSIVHGLEASGDEDENHG